MPGAGVRGKGSKLVERTLPCGPTLRVGHALAVGAVVLLGTSRGDAAIDDFLRGVGRTLGAPFGGFVESLVTPSLQAGEQTGKELVADVDRRVGERIHQIGVTGGALLSRADSLAASRIGQADGAVAARLTQADAMLTARITQLDVGANRTLDRALGRLDGSVQSAVRGLGAEARSAVRQLDQAGKARLEQADAILESRIDQLGAVVNQSIVDLDQNLENRLEQVDDISERRVGNLDVVGTRQVLGAESALTRLAVLAAVLGLIVIFLKSLGAEIWERWEETEREQARWAGRVRSMLSPSLFLGGARVLLAHLAIAGVCVGVVLLVAKRLPRETEQRSQQLLATHQAGFEESIQSIDHRRALYFASQLAIIDPLRSGEYTRRAEKIRLVRDVLVRPGLFQRPDAVRETARRIAVLSAELHDTDGDLLTLQCYVRWQLARNREDEAAASADCQRALALPDHSPFRLRPLAQHYLAALATFPSWRLAELPSPPVFEPPSALLPGLEHIFTYAALVRKLDEDATRAYLQMLAAESDLHKALERLPSKPKALPPRAPLSPEQKTFEDSVARRLAHAEQVVEAWRAFDDALQHEPWLAGTNTELAAFLLDDAVLTRALMVVARPREIHLGLRLAELPESLHRIEAAPLRIEWMRRYFGGLGESVARIVSYEESRRFLDHERELVEFEKAYVAFHLSESPNAQLRFSLALSSARVGLYVSEHGRRRPFAQTLGLVEAAQISEVQRAADERHVRLL
ncbi:MAG TPA: hypothetical protein VFQ61_25565 [Polyangiaceae bacterium]|nr:hypothetical protein [Polyangiaceae bacterium]